MGGGEFLALLDRAGAATDHACWSCAGHRWTGRHTGLANAKFSVPARLVFNLPPSPTQPCVWAGSGRGVVRACQASRDDGLIGVAEFPPAPVRGRAGWPRPDGYQWPIPYLAPFSRAIEFSWQGQWALNAWPNFVITFGLLLVTFYLAWSRGYSPLEMVSARLDEAFVAALRRRFPR